MSNTLKILAGCTLLMGAVAPSQAQQKQPNFVLYLTEDLSPHYLAMFNNGKGVKTPNLEALANEGVNYTNTYSNAAVSSAARTTLVTGCYAPRFGGSLHRRLEPFTMPMGAHMFPYYLRQVGYYTEIAKKTDFNIVDDPEAWDAVSKDSFGWRKRKDKNQPFFYQVSNMVTHEFNLHFSEETFKNKKTINNPDSVNLHSYLPDTKLVRYAYATIYDRIQSSDKELGNVVANLRKDGLMDDTFIFFMGDNGGVLPGTKGYTNNIGLEVPMIVYIPTNWRERIGKEIGTECGALVSFMDIAPTLLKLAGAELPEHLDGKPFLGEGTQEGQEAVFGYGDRYDEYYSFNRSVRVGNLRYARNYQPYQPKGLYAGYRYKQLAFKEWHQMWVDGKLTPEQSKFFEPQLVEELYDLEADPQEKVNLATDPRYAKELKALRGRLNKYTKGKCDLGFMPENLIIEQGLEDTEGFAVANKKVIASAQRIANFQYQPYRKVKKQLAKAISSSQDVDKWWAMTSAASFGKEAQELVGKAAENLTAQRAYVRSRAMLFLAIAGEKISQKQIQEAVDMSKNVAEALIVLNDVAYLIDYGYVGKFEINVSALPFTHESMKWRVDHIAGRMN